MGETGEIGIQTEITDKMMRKSKLSLFRTVRNQMRAALYRKLVLEGVTEHGPEQWSHTRYVTHLFTNCVVTGPHWHWNLVVDRNA